MPNLFQQLKGQLGAPVPSADIGQLVNIPELSKYFASRGALSFRGNIPQALGNVAEQQVAYQKQAAEAARRNRIAQLKREIEEQGLGKYQRRAKDVGYDFFDPQGRPITAYQYARGTGTSLSDALQGSSNVQDQQILEEYDALKEVISLASIPEEDRGDEEKEILNEYYNLNPGLKKLKPQQLLNQFMSQYSHVFTMRF